MQRIGFTELPITLQPLTLCRIEGAGHCWPGRPCRMIGDLGEATTDIDANEAMWGLFSTVKLP